VNFAVLQLFRNCFNLSKFLGQFRPHRGGYGGVGQQCLNLLVGI